MVYRISQASNKGNYISSSQYNQRKVKIKISENYQKEVFISIINYLWKIEYNNIIIGLDFNQDIVSIEVQEFYIKLRVKDIHQ